MLLTKRNSLVICVLYLFGNKVSLKWLACLLKQVIIYICVCARMWCVCVLISSFHFSCFCLCSMMIRFNQLLVFAFLNERITSIYWFINEDFFRANILYVNDGIITMCMSSFYKLHLVGWLLDFYFLAVNVFSYPHGFRINIKLEIEPR